MSSTDVGGGDSVAKLFPEWVLSSALCKAVADDPSRFWDCATYVAPDDPTKEHGLARFFDRSTPPLLRSERAFQKTEAAYFGIGDEEYRRDFWGFRPDFVAESKEASVMLILEAKAGQTISFSTWKDPKERAYYMFLRKAMAFKTRGFFYIVPGSAIEACVRCLREVFSSEQSIATGVLSWERLLPFIYDHLVGTTVDQVIKEMKGLEYLRAWRASSKPVP